MNAPAIALIGLSYFASPVELEEGVFHTQNGQFNMPVRMDPATRREVKRLRLYISNNHGKTWTLYDEMAAKGDLFSVKNLPDGLYWFALQLVYDGAKSVPSDYELSPSTKVFVNRSGRVLKIGDRWYYPELLEQKRVDHENLQQAYRVGVLLSVFRKAK